ncbi:retention module-containing protein [Pseudomonas sp. LRF_L74]|uniref:retention module-containing protein n=1 Tax=Pseudomonas sp. LRF_L74 TaxID=3369422 RepID=UPI003F5F7E10
MGVVVQVVGEVFALASDGSRRLLIEGDRVYSGERLQTGAGGAVSVNLPGGQQLVLGRDSEIVLSEQLLSGTPVERPANDQPAPASDADLNDVEQLQAAIEAGVDPTRQAEATAAGPAVGAAGAGGGGGSSFVLLDAVGGVVSSTTGFPTAGLVAVPLFPENEFDALDQEPDAIPGVTPSGLPGTGENLLVLMDDDALPGGNPGGVNDIEDSLNTTGILSHDFGPDGAGTIVLLATGAPEGFTYVQTNDGLLVRQGAVDVLRITLDSASGEYSVTQLNALKHRPSEINEGTLTFNFDYQVTDGNGDAAVGSLTLQVNDDSPVTQVDSASYHAGLDGTVSTLAGNLLAGDSHGGVADQAGADGWLKDADGNGIPLVAVSFEGRVHPLLDGNPVSIELGGGRGTIQFFASGQYLYTPGELEPGTEILNFQYRVMDGDRTVVPGQFNLTLTGHNHLPEVGTATVDLYESGLDGGSGVGITTTRIEGSLNISDADGDTLAVSLVAPPDGEFTSNGEPVLWSSDGAGGLVGSVGGQAVVSLSINATGEYSVELSAALDHPADSDSVGYEFVVRVEDSHGGVNEGSIRVNIRDDAPLAQDLQVSTPEPSADTNLMIILDTSGSMDYEARGTDFANRMALAKATIINLINAYDGLGDVMVRLVGFASEATSDLANSGQLWLTAEDAIKVIEQLSDMFGNGLTNFDAALLEAQQAFADPGRIVDAQNVSYFLSDGQPTANSDWGIEGSAGNEGIDGVEESAWIAFLEENLIKSYALGMGLGSTKDQQQLDPIAYDGQTATDTDALLVKDLAQLDETLQGTVGAAVVSGNLLDYNAAAGGGFGADGAAAQPLLSISHAGVVYDSSSPGYAADSNLLTFTTQEGAIFTIDLLTGAYTYSLDRDIADDVHETFAYVLLDSDGDQSQGSFVLTVEDRSEVQAYDNFAEALIQQVVRAGGSETQVLANFSTVQNGLGGVDNPWIFDKVNNSNVDGDERSVTVSTDVFGADDSHWGINGSEVAFVADKALQLVDGSGDSDARTEVLTPVFTVDSGTTATLSFELGIAAQAGGDEVSWTLYRLGDEGWESTGLGGTPNTGSTITTDTLEAGRYRLLVSANDRTDNNQQLRVALDNLTMVTTAAAMWVTDVTPVTGNLLTDPNDLFDSREAWGTVDDKGSEGATLQLFDGSDFIDVQSSVTIAGQYGSLTLYASGSYTYVPDAELDNVGQEERFTYKLAQADGDSDTASLVIRLSDVAHVAPNVVSDSGDLLGSEASDVLLAGSAGQLLDGGAGDDRLEGGSGADRLLGGEGDDRLIGGRGDDILVGGNGADLFVWNASDRGSDAHDVVRDFNAAEGDVLDLSSLLVGVDDPTDADVLSQYLSFDVTDTSTVVSVSSTGQVADAAKIDQTITLENVVLSGGDAGSIIQGMLDNHTLVA